MIFAQDKRVQLFWIATAVPNEFIVLNCVNFVCFGERSYGRFTLHLQILQFYDELIFFSCFQKLLLDFFIRKRSLVTFLYGYKIIIKMIKLLTVSLQSIKFRTNLNLRQYSLMPPKKSGQKVQETVPKSKSVQKQTKLFESKQPEETSKVQKSRSKQFNEPSTDKSHNHVNLWQYGNGKTPNNLLISSWNVNGIRSVLNKKELQDYLDKVKPDILCVNETKIDHNAYQKDPIKLTGYHGYWNFCKCSAGYSGVAIFSKYLPISVVEDLPQKQHSQEGRVITIEFENFYLITAYIPNAGQKLDRLQYRVNNYDKCFQGYCNQLKKKKTVIICGDLNVCHKEIDIARPKGNEKTAGFTIQERNSFTKFLQNGWIDTFRKFYPDTVKYSWWSMRTGGRAKNIGWRLDYFLIDEKSATKVKDSTINNDIFGSDHCPVELQFQLN